MFLVDDDDAHILDGGEDGGARTDGDAGIPFAQTHPLVELLPRGEAAVQDGRLAPETGAELEEHLRRQGDLGDEEDRRLALFQNFCDEGEIDLRLSASRHAVEKGDRLLRLMHPFDRRRLCGRELFGGILARTSRVGVAKDAPPLGNDRALLFESF